MRRLQLGVALVRARQRRELDHRPRGSASGTEIWVSAIRYVADVSGMKRQVMTRRFDYLGTRTPSDSAVEIPIPLARQR